MPILPAMELVLPLVDAALAEDVGSGDATSLATVEEGVVAHGEIITRAQGVICGLPVAREVFHRVDADLEFEVDVEEGRLVGSETVVARIRGSARGILTAERTALNFLQHLSGIATRVRDAVERLDGSSTRVLDTRKTIPGLRLLAKYAVRCGGGENHRMGLYDMILIKENHITAAGGLGTAVTRARAGYPGMPLEVEVRSIPELEEALEAGPDRILLDNFNLRKLDEAMVRIRSWAAEKGSRPEVEVSGGIMTGNIRDFAKDGVDYISSGSLTHSVRALDMSLNLQLPDGGAR